MENKTHYRKVFKSDHLGVPDLEDLVEKNQRLVFTVKEVRQEINVSVAGRKGNHNIAYFNDAIKPLVLNATNAKIMKKFANSPFVEDWKKIPIELYIDHTVKMKGEVVGGVRIKPVKPVLHKPTLTIEHPRYEAAKAAWNSGKSDGVLKQFEVPQHVVDSFAV